MPLCFGLRQDDCKQAVACGRPFVPPHAVSQPDCCGVCFDGEAGKARAQGQWPDRLRGSAEVHTCVAGSTKIVVGHAVPLVAAACKHDALSHVRPGMLGIGGWDRRRPGRVAVFDEADLCRGSRAGGLSCGHGQRFQREVQGVPYGKYKHTDSERAPLAYNARRFRLCGMTERRSFSFIGP